MTGSTIWSTAKAAMPYPTIARNTRLRLNSTSRDSATVSPVLTKRYHGGGEDNGGGAIVPGIGSRHAARGSRVGSGTPLDSARNPCARGRPSRARRHIARRRRERWARRRGFLPLRRTKSFLRLVDAGARGRAARRLSATESVPIDREDLRSVPGLSRARRRARKARRRLEHAMDDAPGSAESRRGEVLGGLATLGRPGPRPPKGLLLGEARAAQACRPSLPRASPRNAPRAPSHRESRHAPLRWARPDAAAPHGGPPPAGGPRFLHADRRRCRARRQASGTRPPA